MAEAATGQLSNPAGLQEISHCYALQDTLAHQASAMGHRLSRDESNR